MQARRESLLGRLAAIDAPAPLLHADLAALYREEVTSLAAPPHSSRYTAVQRLQKPCAAAVTLGVGSATGDAV